MKRLFQTVIILVMSFSSLYCSGQETLKTPVALTTQINDNKTLLDSVIIYIDTNNFERAKKIIRSIINSEENYKGFYIAGASELKGKYDEIISALNKKAEDQDKQIQSLNQTIEASKKTSQKELIDFMEDFLRKRDLSETQIKELEKARDKLGEDIVNKDKEIIRLNATNVKQRDSLTVEVTNWKEKFQSEKNVHDSLDKKISKFKTAVQFGLSLGFNYYFNNQLDYFVRSDSTIREAGSRKGASGVISSVISIRLSDKDNAVINIPLGDFTSDPNRAVGLFNQRIGLGLGYARKLSDISPNLLITAIINISPYPRIDYNEIKNKKFNMPEFTKLNAQDYGATTDYSYSLTFGLVYNFINSK